MTTVDDGVAVSVKPLRKDAARNRELLILAGRSVFAERGLDASLDDVAHQAGLGVGTAYRHFANKFELARAIFEQAIDDMIVLVERAAAMSDAWDGIVAFVEGAAEAQSVDRGLREVVMGVHDSRHLEQVHDRFSIHLLDLVERAKAAGSVRADLELSDIGVVVTMLCTVADLGAGLAPDLWRRYLPMLLAGLQPGESLPVAALTEPQFRVAMASHKQAQRGPACG